MSVILGQEVIEQSQLKPIFLRSFLTTSFQFCRSRPGLLLKPLGSHVRAGRRSPLAGTNNNNNLPLPVVMVNVSMQSITADCN